MQNQIKNTSTLHSPLSLPHSRNAFTLVELLVVITIIGLLAGMLIPAVNYARESARRTQCINHQRNLALAMLTHETAEGALPGSLDQLGTYKDAAKTPRVYSWVVALMPYVEENTRYDILMADTPDTTKLPQTLERIPVLFCPSAGLDSFAAPNDPRLSYVVNCGPEANSGDGSVVITGVVSIPQTIFRDRRALYKANNKKFKLEDIKDGASNTVLIAENIQAYTWYATTGWADSDPNDSGSTSELDGTRSPAVTASLGFVWSNIAGGAFKSKINDGFAETPTLPDINYARPSSMHPGLVIVAYADGTAKAMNDDVGFGPYLKAVCPNDALAEKPVTAPNANTPGGGLGFGTAIFQQETW